MDKAIKAPPVEAKLTGPKKRDGKFVGVWFSLDEWRNISEELAANASISEYVRRRVLGRVAVDRTELKAVHALHVAGRKLEALAKTHPAADTEIAVALNDVRRAIAEIAAKIG